MRIYSKILLMLVFICAASISGAATGKAIITGTVSGSDIGGTVLLEDTKDGLHINAHVQNIPPGNHGFHIHTLGSCEDQGNAAGGHFNPGGHKHGLFSKDGSKNSHVGDLGNISIDETGFGKIETTLKGVKLTQGKNAVLGRAFIIHAQPDDFGQPTGNAGGRIGCGSIVLTAE